MGYKGWIVQAGVDYSCDLKLVGTQICLTDDCFDCNAVVKFLARKKEQLHNINYIYVQR